MTLRASRMTEFFGALVQRFERVEVLDRALDYMPQIVFRGLFSLNVRFHPRSTVQTALRSLTA